MSTRQATYADYQERAAEFQVGMSVAQWGGSVEESGRVTAVYPAIGQVDVQFPWGNIRLPVIDLQIVDADTWIVAPRSDDTPGGAGTVPMSGGPSPRGRNKRKPSARKVAEAFVKKAIYWTSKDRKYRARQDERDSGTYFCPRCKDMALKRALYKMTEGSRHRLLACPECMFLVKELDLDVGGIAMDEAVQVVQPGGHGVMVKLVTEEE